MLFCRHAGIFFILCHFSKSLEIHQSLHCAASAWTVMVFCRLAGIFFILCRFSKSLEIQSLHWCMNISRVTAVDPCAYGTVRILPVCCLCLLNQLPSVNGLLSFFIHSLLWWYFCMWLLPFWQKSWDLIYLLVHEYFPCYHCRCFACPYGTVLTTDSACLVFVSSESTAKYRWPSFLFHSHSGMSLCDCLLTACMLLL